MKTSADLNKLIDEIIKQNFQIQKNSVERNKKNTETLNKLKKAGKELKEQLKNDKI